jgi:hypothetical protein
MGRPFFLLQQIGASRFLAGTTVWALCQPAAIAS